MSIELEIPDYNKSRIKEAKKLFGFALREDSLALYNRIERPAPSELALAANRRIGADYLAMHHDETKAGDLLLNGLDDTRKYIVNIIDLHPAISFEKALDISQDERTMRGLALLARQSDLMSSTMLKNPGKTYDLSPDQQAIEVADSVTPSYRFGCKAVELVGGEVTPWPLFQRFAPWAAKLAIISYYDHK
jgi:hypothetical protein